MSGDDVSAPCGDDGTGRCEGDEAGATREVVEVVWVTAREIERQLVSSAPRAAEDPHGIFGSGVVVDCVARCGVVAMPAQRVVGLNLHASSYLARRRPGTGAEGGAGADPDAWEFSPSGARMLVSYLSQHPDLVLAVLRSSYRAPPTGADGTDGGFRCGKFVRGVPAEVTSRACGWREVHLPAKLLALDAEDEGSRGQAQKAGLAGTAAGISSSSSSSSSSSARVCNLPSAATGGRGRGSGAGSAWGGGKQNAWGTVPSTGPVDPKEPKDAGRGGASSGGDDSGKRAAEGKGREKKNAKRGAGQKTQQQAEDLSVESAPEVLMVPAQPPAVPAWGGAGTTKANPTSSMTQILMDEVNYAKQPPLSLPQILPGSVNEASPRPHSHSQSHSQPHAAWSGLKQQSRSGAPRSQPGIITGPAAAAAGGGGGGGGWADLLRGGSARGGLATVPSGGGWSMSASSSTTTRAPPKLPVITPERLAAEARRSKVDGFGKIKCLVCGKMFQAYRPLEQHLEASHYGLNSIEAKAIEAAQLAAGIHVPGDGSTKTKPDRVKVHFGEILEERRGRPGDAPIASLAASLAAYIKDAKPSKKDRRAAAAAGTASGRPKAGGELVVNPNQASSTGMVRRRGKEREGGKKKKLTKLKRIIVRERQERASAAAAAAAAAEEDEGKRAATAKQERDADAGEMDEKEGASDDPGREIEVTVEVGRVYVNLVVPDGEQDVAVDLIYLEDDDDDNEEEDDDDDGEKDLGDEDEGVEAKEEEEAEGVEEFPTLSAAAAANETEQSGDAAAADGADAKISPLGQEGPPNPASTAWGGSRGFKDVLLKGPADEDDSAADEVNKQAAKKQKKKARKDPDAPKGLIRTCEVCGLVCSGDIAWESHIVGKKHLKAERRAAAGGGVGADAAGNDGIINDGSSKVKKTKEKPHTYVGADVSVRYANQVITPELNAVVLECIGELKRFQDRAYAKDPIKAKMRRRLVFGLREVAKAIQLKHAKAVVVAPNIEQTQSEGGLDDVLGKMIDEARENGTPTVFALTRNRLGQIVGQRMKISALAVLDYNGADDQFKRMIAETKRGQEEFQKAKESREALNNETALKTVVMEKSAPPLEGAGTVMNTDGEGEKIQEEPDGTAAVATCSGSQAVQDDSFDDLHAHARADELPRLNASAAMFVPRGLKPGA